MLVYDVTSEESFLKLDDWLSACKQKARGEPLYCLVGNKTDKVGERQVESERAIQWARDHNISKFREVSAASDFNIESLFDEFARELYTLPKQT